jgi:hypothetical protein
MVNPNTRSIENYFTDKEIYFHHLLTHNKVFIIGIHFVE